MTCCLGENFNINATKKCVMGVQPWESMGRYMTPHESIMYDWKLAMGPLPPRVGIKI